VTGLDRAVSAGWILLPVAALYSISGAQAIATLLILHWFWSRLDPHALRPVLVPLAAFLIWTVAAALLAEPASPDVRGALEKWIFALTLPAAWAWARRQESIRGPITALLAAGMVILPWGLSVFLSTEGSRAGGFSGSGPHLGSNLMMAFVVASALAFAARRAWVAVGLALSSLLLLAGVGLSLNRSALLGAIVAAVLICARRRPLLLAAGLALVAAGVTAFPLSKPALRLRSALLFNVDDTARERALMWAGGCRMIRARPLAGFTSRSRFADAYSAEYRDAQSREPRPGHVHNSYLQAAVLHGIPGLGLLLWWLAGLVRLALRSREAAAVPLLVAVFVNAGFDFVLADGQHALMWFALVGLLLGSGVRAALGARAGRRV